MDRWIINADDSDIESGLLIFHPVDDDDTVLTTLTYVSTEPPEGTCLVGAWREEKTSEESWMLWWAAHEETLAPLFKKFGVRE
jgi:hypothetical protein